MIDPEDFPMTAYGAAIFTAANPQPIMVVSSPALAIELVRRLNEGELAARICDAVAQEEHAAARRDGGVAAEQCARLIRGREQANDAGVMETARGEDPPQDSGAWSLDRGVNPDSDAP